jgi:alpha-amylase/alpha-mannosidase (GH57 family)
MAKLSFLWHLHQPPYRTADGVSHAPWVAVHAGGAYRTLAAAIAVADGRGQVVNIVPALVEQLIAYRDGRVHDPVLATLTTPSNELTDGQREVLVSWAFHVTPRQLQRYPRLAELARRRPAGRGPRTAAAFGPGDLRDLQVLFILAQAGEQAWRDPELAPLAARGRGYSPAQHSTAAAWLDAQPGELLALWAELAGRPGVEISTSPFAHPIMPLLIDTGIVVDSWAPDPAPPAPPFARPEDAALQLEHGLELMRGAGFDPAGCWPPEGSVSAAALAVYADAGVRWLVTDEGILAKSLGRNLRENGHASAELYHPWTLTGPSPAVFFRDRELSDAIGFRYGRWDDEARAARSLVDDLAAIGRTLAEDATIVLALDGENPWLHYPDGGGRFLRTLMEAIGEAGDELRPATLSSIAATARPGVLDRIHPGSWINGTFATWIGHPEKSAAWALLGEVRDAIGRSGRPSPPSLLAAEASDWFWWLGDDNPTELAPLYDLIFRSHLEDACRQAGVAPPVALSTPLKTVCRPVKVPLAHRWRPPELDGRITSYFEWCLATPVEIAGDHAVDRLSLWAGPKRLHLLIEGAQEMDRALAEAPLHLRLARAGDATVAATLDGSRRGDADLGCAVARVAELTIAWDGRRGSRLELSRGDGSLLGGAVLLLDPEPVDESSEPTTEG